MIAGSSNETERLCRRQLYKCGLTLHRITDAKQRRLYYITPIDAPVPPDAPGVVLMTLSALDEHCHRLCRGKSK